jgi:dUTP pyrophosphatase
MEEGLNAGQRGGIIDPFYSGDNDEINIQLLNFTDNPIIVNKGEALAQGVLIERKAIEWVEVDTMSSDGHGGYKTL